MRVTPADGGHGSRIGLAPSFARCVAEALDVPGEELPPVDMPGTDWRGPLRQWLARRHLGLLQIANPGSFSWPGYWIAVIEAEGAEERTAVLMFGPPSGVVAAPGANDLLGRGASDLAIAEGFVIAPFDAVRQPVQRDPSLTGTVVGVYFAEAAGSPLRSVEQATAIAGRGLEGDRYAAKAGTFTPSSAVLKGYDLTLIESEVLDRLTLPDGTHLDRAEARRNVVTSGIDLNALVGRRFTIGGVLCFGQRLCEPCIHLERLTRPGVLGSLVHRGGLRADLLSGGALHAGDPVRVVP